MAFNPFKEKGTPIEKQTLPWSELNIEPYDKNTIHPYTQTRIILMNGIEVEGIIFSHQFSRHTDDAELKGVLATSRRIEQQQQKWINWLPPGDMSNIEVAIGYEQVAVDLTAWLAQTEPDPYVKQALDFALLEDFDHLYRYSNLLQLLEGKEASKIVQEYTEITPGRPTIEEHRHPMDSMRKHYENDIADPLTKLHVMTIVAGEQQTMNLYMTIGNREQDPTARGLYAEIGMIEEQHVTQYAALADPRVSWFEMWLLHEYNECYMYYSCMESETDQRVKKLWEMALSQEIEHLQIANRMMQQHEKRDGSDLFPDGFPELTIFQSNIDYVREVLAEQVDLTASGMEFVPKRKAPKRYEEYQKMVNGGEYVPSELVIEQNIDKNGKDYRQELKGPNPVERLRQKEMAVH